MPRPNLHDPVFDEQRTDAPLRGRTMQVGRPAGCDELGATLYEIEPGQSGSPYHLHLGNEELLIVLAGTPTVRTPDGSVELRSGDVLAFPVGPTGAHQVQNRTGVPVRVLVISTTRYPEVAELPDSDKVLVLSARPGAPDRLMTAFPRAAAVPRLAGELDDESA